MGLKIGQGYDIHKLVKNRDLIIGNVKIPFSKGFLAHSDGDVLIHAIIDSILGAVNLGDIGTLFPDNDMKYKNIDSSILLQKVMALIVSYKIINIDATIIAESPKLKPYIQSIKQRLSSIMKIEIDKISIKAKTKEGLDSVGKGKAIEVFAVCLLEF